MVFELVSSSSALLTGDERAQLIQPERLDIGNYYAWGSPRKSCAFVVELDARPLVALIDEASFGNRVYEFMSISRPGDLLNYLYLSVIDVDDEVVQRVNEFIGRNTWKLGAYGSTLLREMPFTWFDNTFSWQGDDTHPFSEQWLLHREGDYWMPKLDRLFLCTKTIQERLRQVPDFLIQHENRLMDQKNHRRDYWAFNQRKSELEVVSHRETSLPKTLFDLVEDLTKSGKVNSVSCPFSDYPLWRMLVAEQVSRSQTTGLPPQEAFQLSGPDSGLNFEVKDWGGEVLIPYEGAAAGELFIKPGWRKFLPEQAGKDGSLALAAYGSVQYVAHYPCRYVLSEEDYGELECATRTEIGDWVLYETKD